jgi:DNA-binding CsgD family transcriptional regulator
LAGESRIKKPSKSRAGAARVKAASGSERRAPRAPAPALRMSRFELGGDDYTVLSYPSPRVELPGLSAAESEVAALLVEGRTHDEIAKRRGTSKRTVANQIASIYKKLGISSRAELVLSVMKDQSVQRP